jgi:Tol biopolymer transport system component/C-terminal processing protease CtpA/Prc
MKRLLVVFSLFLAYQASANEEWMRYSAISPDGTTIAFAYQGDIFTVAVSGGEAKQITSHAAYDYMPVWSHDSKKIAFASNRHGNFDVFLVEKDGGVPKRLTFHSSGDYPYAFDNTNTKVYFQSGRLDDYRNVQFPDPMLGEIYEVSIEGGREYQYVSFCAEDLQFSKDGQFMIFHDKKGYEDPWRKHQTSSVARDVMLYDAKSKNFRKLTTFEGEDRDPSFIDNNSFYFLSEKSGSFNIWKGNVNGNAYEQQITSFKDHPVRFLSMADNGTLCFGYHGSIYTLTNGQPTKLVITIKKDAVKNDVVTLPTGGKASEFAVSPDGNEIVYVARGEIFVSSVEFGTTKQITNTPQQERNVSFSPDGKKILFAAERTDSWDIYEISRLNEAEKHFYNSTLLKETLLVDSKDEDFDPKYSPNGEEVAFFKDRTTICIINIKSKAVRTVLPGSFNYSYSDGDQYFTWSPDSRYLLVQYFEFERWNTDIGLVDVTGKEKTLNLTESGYGSSMPKFAMDGQMVYYTTDKYGFRSHGSWGAQGDVEAVFLTKDAYYRFTLSEEEYKNWKVEEEEANKNKSKEEESKEEKKKKDTKAGDEKKEEVKPIVVDIDGLHDRKVRLTIHSSFLADYLINNEGTEMYYLSNFEKDYDLWVTKFKTKETKILSKLGMGGSNLISDKEMKNLYFNNNGTVTKYEIASSTPKPISSRGEMNWNAPAEREYMFEHAWRQTREKFYVEDLHGVNWDFYKKEYQQKLASINNGYDFAELLSELLGELNASHTGARYREYMDGDQTAALGCYFDESYKGDGLKIVEIMDKSPLILHKSKAKSGVIIEKIDGEAILKDKNYLPMLNRKIGKKVLISYFDPSTKQRWDETVTPISFWEENYLTYERWIKHCEHVVDSVSGGKVGYVHVEGMDSPSFRKVFDKALGKLNKREALIVDTRFNGGGWLHDDLATFLSGKIYMQFEPRGQKNMGGEPIWKWQKKSCVLMSEGNYSDAHLFPVTYKALNIGPLIGMPVPGTGTAVWWERMIDGSTVFGIPQVGMRSISEGYLVENKELQPDIKVQNDYNEFLKGNDQQLIKAVQEMMKK